MTTVFFHIGMFQHVNFRQLGTNSFKTNFYSFIEIFVFIAPPPIPPLKQIVRQELTGKHNLIENNKSRIIMVLVVNTKLSHHIADITCGNYYMDT